jgi:hypothetical protein
MMILTKLGILITKMMVMKPYAQFFLYMQDVMVRRFTTCYGVQNSDIIWVWINLYSLIKHTFLILWLTKIMGLLWKSMKVGKKKGLFMFSRAQNKDNGTVWNELLVSLHLRQLDLRKILHGTWMYQIWCCIISLGLSHAVIVWRIFKHIYF